MHGKDPDSFARMIGKTAEAPFAPPASFPAEWDVGDGRLHVFCDAAVQSGLPDRFSVCRVKRMAFTAQHAADVLRLFTDGDTVFPGFFETDETKEELIRQRNNILAVLERGGLTDDLAELLTHIAEEEIDPRIDAAPLAHKAQTDVLSAAESGSFFFEKDGYWYQLICGRTGMTVDVEVCKTLLQHGELVYQGNELYGEAVGTQIVPEISEADALRIADGALQTIGCENMTLAAAETGRLACGERFYGEDAVCSQGWTVYYMYDADGLTGYPVHDGIDPEQEQYRPSWPAAMLSLYVDAQGVRRVHWQGLCADVGTVNDNAAVMSFDEAYPILCDQLRYRHSYQADAAETTVRIDLVRLETALLAAPNEPDYGYYVPVWHIHYSYSVAGDPLARVLFGNLFINAIDGSAVETQYLP